MSCRYHSHIALQSGYTLEVLDEDRAPQLEDVATLVERGYFDPEPFDDVVRISRGGAARCKIRGISHVIVV